MKQKFLLTLAACGLSLAQLAGAATEAPPVLRASEFLPPELRAGPGFTVDEEVPTDGFHGLFTLRSRFGTLSVRGVDRLRIRVAEQAALEEAADISRSQAMTGGMRDSAADAKSGARQVLHNPVGTVAKISQGVGGLFKRVGQKASGAVSAVAEKTADSDAEAKAASKGGNEGRRAWAKKLGVDPYTTNPLLAKRLDELARASRAGNAAVAVATGGASRWAALGAKVLNDAYDLSPADLKAKNQKRLLEMGVEATTVKTWFGNRCWTPTTQTALVECLDELKGVEGRSAVVKLAGDVRSFDEAGYVVLATRLLSGIHQRTSPLRELVALGRLPAANARAGGLVLPGPIDYLSDIPVVSEFVRRPDLPAGQRDLFVTGRVSPLAQEEFTRAGWTVHAQFTP